MKIRDVIKLIENDGWYLKETKGSHRQYKYYVKSGKVTIPGKLNDDVHPKTLKSIIKASTIRIMKFAIVIEKEENNFSAYVPDLPGCVSTGSTIDEVKQNIHDAIEFHIEGLKKDGEEIPLPVSISDSVEVAA